MTLKARVNFDLAAKLITALDLATPSAPHALRGSYGFAEGAGANQANRIWQNRSTIAPSGTEDIDLAGTLTDALGAATVFARVKAIAVKAADTNANNVHVGGDVNALIGWVANATDIVVVRPGGCFIWVAPDATGAAVTAGTGDILQVANSGAGTSVTYEVVIIGAAS